MTLLESVFNHLVLPPRLPGHQDEGLGEVEQCILTRLISACDSLIQLTGEQFEDTWASLRHSLSVCRNLNWGRLEQTSLRQEFCNLQPNVLLILYVVEQNAAILLRRDVK